MGYQTTLEKAGAEVLDFKEIGSYQGTWGAIVNFQGKKALVTGSYCSCSGCDSYEAEFGWNEECEERDGKYFVAYDEVDKETYDTARAALDKKLSDFGTSYLQTLLDKADAENRLKGFNTEDWFDEEEKELFDWALTLLS